MRRPSTQRRQSVQLDLSELNLHRAALETREYETEMA